MAEELAYVLINPYTIIKSRTGGVIARLFARSSADLVAAQMFAPSEALIKDYLELLKDERAPQARAFRRPRRGSLGIARAKLEEIYRLGEHPEVRELIQEYIRENYSQDKNTGTRRRVMFLLFRGENAITRLHDEVVGHITKETIAGETIRDTYGDYIRDSEGRIKYFEPAVMIGTSKEMVQKELDIWVRHSDADSGMLKEVVKYKAGIKPQATLVLIKPDCFQWPSGRAGNIIDMFSKTGLYIIAAKVVRMSIEQAEEFYGPVREVLVKKFKNKREAEIQFNKIIKFMTGYDPTQVASETEKSAPGKVKCLALVYQGEDAVRKIRSVLGTTDPSQAAPATVRKEFGRDILVNTAHASDSPENAVREMNILRLEENDLKRVVEEF